MIKVHWGWFQIELLHISTNIFWKSPKPTIPLTKYRNIWSTSFNWMWFVQLWIQLHYYTLPERWCDLCSVSTEKLRMSRQTLKNLEEDAGEIWSRIQKNLEEDTGNIWSRIQNKLGRCDSYLQNLKLSRTRGVICAPLFVYVTTMYQFLPCHYNKILLLLLLLTDPLWQG